VRRHFTASAVVLDQVARKVLLVHHAAEGKWVFPGGHIDTIDGVMELPHGAALREVYEEAGVTARIHRHDWWAYGKCCTMPTPWITALHPAPEKPVRADRFTGQVKPAEEAHEHIDFLFIATASSTWPLKQPPPDEAHGAQWVDVIDVWKMHTRSEVLQQMWSALARLDEWRDSGD
jgi:8-oxo-dGTP pyrophosphatase MutT (NUDIX family)